MIDQLTEMGSVGTVESLGTEKELEVLREFFVEYISDEANTPLFKKIEEKIKVEYVDRPELRKKVELRIKAIYFGVWLCHKELGLRDRLKTEMPDFQFDFSNPGVVATTAEGLEIYQGIEEDVINRTPKAKLFDRIAGSQIDQELKDNVFLKYTLAGVEEYGHWLFLNLKDASRLERAFLDQYVVNTKASFAETLEDRERTYHTSDFEYYSLIIQLNWMKKFLPSFFEEYRLFVDKIREPRKAYVIRKAGKW